MEPLYGFVADVGSSLGGICSSSTRVCRQRPDRRSDIRRVAGHCVRGQRVADVQNVPPVVAPPNSYGYPPNLVTFAPQLAAGLTPSSLLMAIALRRGQPQGPANDQEAEEFIYDALELLPGAADVEVRCDGGRVTLTGSVPHKRVKHDVGEIAWAIPALNDVQNNVTIASRRRARGPNRETESPQSGAGRKQA